MTSAICGSIYKNGDQPKARDPLVIGASKNLDMQISDLHERVVELISRLSSVSRIYPPCPVEDKLGKQIKESTLLSNTLDSYAERVFAMRNDVRDAIDRLEI